MKPMEGLFKDTRRPAHTDYLPVLMASTQRKELCIFSDASTVAIGAVAYLRAADTK